MILLNRLIASFQKRRLEAELDQELRFHFEMETAENERRGMSAEDARMPRGGASAASRGPKRSGAITVF